MTKDDAFAILLIADLIREIQGHAGWYARGSMTDTAIQTLRSAARHLARSRNA